MSRVPNIVSKHYRIGDVIQVRVEKIVPRGFGLAFAENLTVLTPFTAPGDVLKVRIAEVKKRMAFAEIVEIVEPGPRRVEPLCEYFGKCGGCNFQQLSYSGQLAAKIGIVRDCLNRIGKINYEAEIQIVSSPSEFGYRSRARWHLDRTTRRFGYYRRDSHEVIDLGSCPILTPGLQSTLEYTRQSLDWESLWSEQAEIEAATGEGGRVSLYSAEMAEPTAELTHKEGDETYLFSAQTFFQTNKFLIGALISAAIGNMKGKTAYDLYSGVGLFTLPLGRRFEKVVAVESNPIAARFAAKNIENARLSNVENVEECVEGFLKSHKHGAVDLLVLDPPRAGTEKGTIQTIADIGPDRISYVSCEPSILARDLRVLLDANYQIESITAIDLFPQTHHIETVANLTLIGNT